MAQLNLQYEGRGHWKRSWEFVLSLVGYTAGMGNLWRFPYLAMRNGGGAFLVPYLVFALTIGIPLVSLETALGQYFQLSPLMVFNMCPLFKGLGISLTALAFVGYLYYMVILAWALFYLASSFTSVLPWATCDNAWNTNSCVPLMREALQNASNAFNASSSSGMLSTREFWRREVLDMSSGFDEPGHIRWQLLIALIVSFALIYICIFKGVASSRIAVYITATTPFLLLITLLAWLLTQPGSQDGLLYFLTPRWERVNNFQTWLEAFLQVFFSIGVGFGTLVNLSSYNPFHHNCLGSSVIVVMSEIITAVLCGAVVFAGVGCLSYQTKTDVDEAMTTGPGLSFVTYPQVVASMPVPHLWAVCFFLLILFLGLDSQFAMVKTATAGITDLYPKTLKRYQPVLVLVVLIISLFLSLPFITQGGIYAFHIVDWYASFLTILIAAICESVVVGWIYGGDRFISNIKEMGDFAPSWYLTILKYCWKFLIPLSMTSVLILAIVKFRSPTYGDYVYPPWTDAFGWLLALSTSLPIPVVMVYMLMTEKGTLRQRFKQCVIPRIGRKGVCLAPAENEMIDSRIGYQCKAGENDSML